MSTNYQDEAFVRTLLTQRQLHHVSELAHEVLRLRGVAEQLRRERDVERESGRIARDKALAEHRARRRLQEAVRTFLPAYVDEAAQGDKRRAMERALVRALKRALEKAESPQ